MNTTYVNSTCIKVKETWFFIGNPVLLALMPSYSNTMDKILDYVVVCWHMFKWPLDEGN